MSTHNIEKELQRFCDSNSDAIDLGASNTLKTDLIGESTANTGVTIDGALIKDSGWLASGSVLSTGGLHGYTTGAGGAVTQITDATTGVTLHKSCGQITTVALTTAAAEERFTVTNILVAATDTIVLATTYNGAGTPMLSVLKVASGAFDIVITNVHAANALDAVMVINFAIIKAVAA